jgi:glycosyltransferase involved in cell wall biosynthesis
MTSFDGLRVGLIGPLPPPAGGMAMQTEQLARLLRSAGADVDILQTNAPYRPSWVAKVRGLRALFRLLPYLWRVWRLAGNRDVLHLMANSGWSWHLFAAPVVWIASWRATPVVVNYRGGAASDFLAQSPRLIRATMKRTAALIVPSRYLQNVFGRFGVDASVVPNVIDLSFYKPGQMVEEDGNAHIVVTRNLEPIYDNASAIKAFAMLLRELPAAKLTVAGSGPELGRLQALVAELGLNEHVMFAGRLERSGMAGLYQSAHLMWNPSLTDNMPNSVLEALASGVPVVSTNVGGVPYVLEHERTGLLVDAGRPDALSAAALRVLGDADLRKRLVSEGLREVRRYTWTQVAPLLQATYQQAIGRN